MPEGHYALYGSGVMPQPQSDAGSTHRYEISDNLREWNGRDDESTVNEALRRTSENFRDTLLDLYAALKVFGIYLITFEGLFVMLFSVVTTSLYYHLGDSSTGASFGANISWTIVSFTVVSPMIMQITQAFARREQALDALSESRSLILNIMLANALWNWGDNGRKKLPHDHAQKTKTLLKGVLNDTMSLLIMPTFTRGRHRLTSHGRKHASQFGPSVRHLQLQIVNTIRQLHEQVEVMKACGIPANEASRVNQYHWLLEARLERLQNIKFYRTPQATRSFTRLFILALPVFYGPYYVFIARGNEYQATNFAFCLVLSVSTSLLMIGIFNVERTMEDPFAGGGMDGVRVLEVFQLTHRLLDECHSEKHIAEFTTMH